MSSSGQNNQGVRKGTGRKKTMMEKMDNDYNRRVTFSKRRVGLFKKANELITLCGAEAAIVVFSPGNKVYSFGSPSVDEIANRFVGVPTSQNRNLVASRRKANHDLNSQLNHIQAQLEVEKKHAKELNNLPRLNIENLNLEELERLRELMVNLQQECEARVQNGMKFTDNQLPNTDLSLGNESTTNVNVPFIRNMTGGQMLASNNQPLASSGTNFPAPHFTKKVNVPFIRNVTGGQMLASNIQPLASSGTNFPAPHFTKNVNVSFIRNVTGGQMLASNYQPLASSGTNFPAPHFTKNVNVPFIRNVTGGQLLASNNQPLASSRTNFPAPHFTKNVNVPFIRNVTRGQMLASNNQPFASSGTNFPAPHFTKNVNVPFIRNVTGGKLLASNNQPLASSATNFPAPHFPVPFPPLGRSLPWARVIQYGSGSGGNMDWYKGSSSIDMIPYRNAACANDEEASGLEF